MKKPKFHENCAVRVAARLTYCKRILLQQKFDLMLEELKSSSQKFDLSVAIPSRRISVATDIDVYSRKGVVGGRSPSHSGQFSRDSPRESPREIQGGKSPPVAKGGWIKNSNDFKEDLSSSTVTNHHRVKSNIQSPDGRSSKSSPRSSIQRELATDAFVNHESQSQQDPSEVISKRLQGPTGSCIQGTGVYDVKKEFQSPSKQPKRALRIIGLRERQGDFSLSASDLCSRSCSIKGSSSTRNDEKVAGQVPHTACGSGQVRTQNSLPHKIKDEMKINGTSKNPMNTITNNNSVSEEKKDIHFEDSPNKPNLSIFKSSRTRYAVQEKTNKEKIKLRAEIALITSPRLP